MLRGLEFRGSIPRNGAPYGRNRVKLENQNPDVSEIVITVMSTTIRKKREREHCSQPNEHEITFFRT